MSCFALLKRACKEEIDLLTDSYIDHVDKKAFLVAYKQVYESLLSSNNTRRSFTSTRLVLDNPEAVQSSLKQNSVRQHHLHQYLPLGNPKLQGLT